MSRFLPWRHATPPTLTPKGNPMLLSDERIRSLHTAAVGARLTEQRAALFERVNKHFYGSIARAPTEAAQLLIDLHRMNEIDALTDGSVPLEAWLSQAVLLTTSLPQQQEFQDALHELRRVLQQSKPTPSGPKTSAPPPRRHFLDEAPFDFSRPEGQSLWGLLEQSIYRLDDTVAIIDKAGVQRGRIQLEQPPRARWHNILEAAAQQRRARRLVEAIAEDPEWAGLRDRLHELLSNAPPAEPGQGAIAWRAKEPAGGDERLMGKRPNWVDVAFLETGLARARSVVRVTAFFDGQSLVGTGFFIAPGRVLTNHHVLFYEGAAADRVILWMDYAIQSDGTLPLPTQVIIAEPKIQGDSKHDWGTLEVPDPRAAAVPALSLGSQQAVKAGDHVSIIQHPHGLPKKLGVFGSEVRYADKDVIQYLTDTEQGSSGSPVFNHRWEVVALHHRWTVAGEKGGEQECRNQGVNIDRVIEALRARALLA